MNEILKEKLEEGEDVLFSTGAADFETMDRTNKPGIIRKIVISAAVTLALNLAYIISASKTGDVKWGLVAVLAAIGAYVCISGFITAKKVRKYEYFITDRRIAVVSDTVKDVYFKDIKKYNFSKDADGNTTLLVGEKALSLAAAKWRGTAEGPVDRDENSGEVLKAVVYAIKDAKGFEKKFEEQMAKAAG